MGDRANVYVKNTDSEGVYLYTHWNGSNLPKIVQEALAKRERWNDAPYLARIVFCAMVGGDVAGTTGYGISASLTDNNHPILVLDARREAVSVADEGDERAGPYRKTISMEEYLALEDPGAWRNGE